MHSNGRSQTVANWPNAVAALVIAEGFVPSLNPPKPSSANSPSRCTWLTTTRRVIELLNKGLIITQGRALRGQEVWL